jgi:hypothetical protein
MWLASGVTLELAYVKSTAVELHTSSRVQFLQSNFKDVEQVEVK